MESVIFLIFNRPETTKKVFERIREAQPSQLFIVADGPRLDRFEDKERCKEARRIAEQVDWDCQVFRNFSETNLGCKARVESGLSWAFEEIDRAIILEDDCLPDASFFRFCSELLDYYENDERVMAISGNNFQFGCERTKDSYYFSRYPHCWGWATWKRAWRHYDADMQFWPQVKQDNRLKDIFYGRTAISYWHSIFQRTYTGDIDSWDYVWTLACWLQSGLCILPKNNLVSNIGFAADGTHLTYAKSPFSNMSTTEMTFPLKHPSIVLRNDQADRFTQFYQFGLLFRLYRKIRSIVRY
ncbi:hypothetical protein S7335_3834 [Synechococcus sp. PCC 7335]|uniref:hypothetical protein n=1 Tax=Synechococcus sp. (strain ATCC 29403 / PCC 7335) TaxID=91464 RepID=UPI00017EC78B|nr:hypothetical protein [Synechococcus sp. PCC 7335]EDX86131.1 hypothetical protein S7335_3834 [Synechococcus sp. PCC 7335]